ncbi:alpha/beta fold hydrolase [Streptomyces sp. NPDC006743]|uniref:alpha/beta fold hydrolase n=1 Tax=Streptomyces sp. NPDC006743 TaxID=3154480 RepID=UPI003454D8C8
MNSTPVVFVHGAWFHALSWEAWAERFTSRGFTVWAPGWPGEPDSVREARRRTDVLRGLGLDALTDHFGRLAASFDEPPVLIGHSVGGLVVQHLLGRGLGRAAVAVAPAPIANVAPRPGRDPLGSPGATGTEGAAGAADGGTAPAADTGMYGGATAYDDTTAHGDPAAYDDTTADGSAGRYGDTAMYDDKTANGGATAYDDTTVPLSREEFRRVFANTVGAEESARLYDRYVVPAPRRLLTDLGRGGPAPHPRTVADVGNTVRGPLLLISGQEDRVVPDSLTRAAYKLYGDSVAVSDLKQFADRGHTLTVDSGWRAVADHVLDWLAEQGIHADGPAR